ncbi:hypothetical protein Tco_0971333 [Tanacetum coccineum]
MYNKDVKHAGCVASAQKNKGSLEAESIVRAASTRVRASVSANRNYWGLKISLAHREKLLLKIPVVSFLERRKSVQACLLLLICFRPGLVCAMNFIMLGGGVKISLKDYLNLRILFTTPGMSLVALDQMGLVYSHNKLVLILSLFVVTLDGKVFCSNGQRQCMNLCIRILPALIGHLTGNVLQSCSSISSSVSASQSDCYA